MTSRRTAGREHTRDQDYARDRGRDRGREKGRAEDSERSGEKGRGRGQGITREDEIAEWRREGAQLPKPVRRSRVEDGIRTNRNEIDSHDVVRECESAPLVAKREYRRHSRRSEQGRKSTSTDVRPIDVKNGSGGDEEFANESTRASHEEHASRMHSKDPRSPRQTRSLVHKVVRKERKSAGREYVRDAENGNQTSPSQKRHIQGTADSWRDARQLSLEEAQRGELTKYHGRNGRGDRRHDSKPVLPQDMFDAALAKVYNKHELREWKADQVEVIISPSRLWRRTPLLIRFILVILGFTLMYYLLFFKHDWEDQFVDENGNLLPLNDTGRRIFNQKRPPPIWHTNLVPASVPEPAKLARKLQLETLAKEAAGIDELEEPQTEAPSTTPQISTSGTYSEPSSTTSTQRDARPAGATKSSGTSPGRSPADDPNLAAEISTKPPSSVTTSTTASTTAADVAATSRTTDAASTISSSTSESEEDKPPTDGEDSIPESETTSNAEPEVMSVDASSLATPRSQNGTTANGSRFSNLEPNVPPGEVPVLQWNYDKVADPSTAKQIFALGYNDHVAAFKPLCIMPDNKIFTLSKPRACGGFNRTEGWMLQYCDTVETSYDKESNLEKQKEAADTWLDEQEKAERIHWVEGLTILQILEKNCGNIAHFAGRALMLQHVMENIDAYAADPTAVENILVVPTFHIMKRFLYPHNYAFWHKTLMKALLAPAKYTIGTLGNFLYRAGKEPYDGTPRVQLLHNFSLDGSNLEDDKIVCFKRAIVPSYLKDRYFVDDMEYPSGKPSLQSTLPKAPRIPRDSIRLREQVSALLHESVEYPQMAKTVVYLDRAGERRKIAESAKERLLTELEEAAKKRSFDFRVVSFDDMAFKEQVASIESAGIAIGVHGANLVNTMFMPPLSALIELFPFQFHHGMYEEGGKAGLKYYSYTMATGVKFQSRQKYKNTETCIKLNNECKVFYRDQELKPSDEDYQAIIAKLEEAMDWYDEVGKNSKKTRNSATPSKPTESRPSQKRKNRRRVRRRRLVEAASTGHRENHYPHEFAFRGLRRRKRGHR